MVFFTYIINVCVYTHMHTHMCIHIYTDTYIFIHIDTYICIHKNMYLKSLQVKPLVQMKQYEILEINGQTDTSVPMLNGMRTRNKEIKPFNFYKLNFKDERRVET